jgi:light-harvesting complex 1 beta chain
MEASMVSNPTSTHAGFATNTHEGFVTNTHQGFSLIYMAGFAVILVIALTAQVLQLRWRAWFPGAEGDKSMFRAVKDSVYTFMSYLT